MAAPASNDLLLLVLHYLQEQELTDTARTLERETGILFNVDHFEDMIMSGQFDEAEQYLDGFTSLDDNKYSARIIFLIKKLKLLEALHDGARKYAADIIETEFHHFDPYDIKIYERAMELLAVKDLSTHPMLNNFQREKARENVADEIKKCLQENPVFKGKLEFPTLQTTLQRLISNGYQGRNGIVVSLLPNRNRSRRN